MYMYSCDGILLLLLLLCMYVCMYVCVCVFYFIIWSKGSEVAVGLYLRGALYGPQPLLAWWSQDDMTVSAGIAAWSITIIMPLLMISP